MSEKRKPYWREPKREVHLYDRRLIDFDGDEWIVDSDDYASVDYLCIRITFKRHNGNGFWIDVPYDTPRYDEWALSAILQARYNGAEVRGTRRWVE